LDNSDIWRYSSGVFAFCPGVFLGPERKSRLARRLRQRRESRTRSEATIGARIVRRDSDFALEKTGFLQREADKTTARSVR
jgi:hypothetical protein